MASRQSAASSATTLSPSTPLLKRVESLVKHTQFAWWTGHVILLLSTLRYSFGLLKLNLSSLWLYYRLAYVAAIFTYSVVSYKKYFAKGFKADQKSLLKVFTDDNTLYLIMALVWLFTRPIYVSLLPYATFSVFHALSYLRSDVLPSLFPASVNPQQSTVGRGPASQVSQWIQIWVKQNYEPAMRIVSIVEVVVISLRLILGLFIRATPLITIVVYLIFLRFKFATSEFTRESFRGVSRRIDVAVADGRVPPAIREGWNSVKRALGAFSPIIKDGNVAMPQPKKTE